mmetsp:Transcript_1619/g.3895  ORF Transcript_1619/g.3895 Transcript_1619/m.3895 type:complete len:182 (+) Transcript_1619:208-753(+)
MISTQTIFFALGSLQFPYLAIGFLPKTFPSISSYKHFAQMSYEDIPTGDAAASTGSIRRHPSELPGDPSLVLVTNLDLGDKKLDVMKKCSKAISDATGKPEAYIGVSITDNASVLFGGSDDPCALGNLYSIGSIAIESNGKIQSSVTDFLEEFGLKEDRMYINFFDMPRANVGWSRRTFAG